MLTTHRWTRLIRNVIFVVLGAIVCFQTYLVVNNYIRRWRMPIWRLRYESSFSRSAVFILSNEGADFLRFINTVLPSGVKVVPPEKSGAFSEQSIMQFFMLDKSIMLCPSGEARIVCLSRPDKYLIATTAYPPHESDINKTFIAYPNANADYPYEGIYVPRDYSEGTYSAVYPETYNILRTVLFDMGILLAWFLLGGLIVSFIIRDPMHPIIYIIGFPVGMGVFTWVLFIVCLLGAPLTLGTISITYMGLLLLAIIPARQLIRAIKISRISLEAQLQKIRIKRFNPLMLGLCILFGFLLLALIYIGVGRGYSTFDDMAIWSLKGYYMAYKHDMLAAIDASGHGLSYPLNISLAISSFFLIDQDLLPGSKLALLSIFLSMLACIYWFLRKNKISGVLACLCILLVLSTPVIFEYASFGFANMPFTCYLVIGTLLGILGVTQNNKGFLYSSGLTLSLAGWTRPEGIGFALLLACLVMIFARKQRINHNQLLTYLFVTIFFCGTWMALGFRYFQGDEIGTTIRLSIQALKNGTFSPSTIWLVLEYAWRQFNSLNMWGVIVPLSLITTIGLLPVAIRKKSISPLILISASLGTFLIPLFMFVAKYYGGTSDFVGFLGVSFDRAQFPAIILLITAFILMSGVYSDKQAEGSEEL
jgi:hypothetical protein